LDTALENTLKIVFQRDKLIYFGTGSSSKRKKILENLIGSLSRFDAFTFLKGKEKITYMLSTEDNYKNQTVLRDALTKIDRITTEKLGSDYPNFLN
jgi:hypothetical protein